LNNVVFPDPLGPITPWISLAATSSATPSSACTPLDRLLTESTLTRPPYAGGLATFSLGGGGAARAVRGIGIEGQGKSNRRRRSEAAPASPRGANTTVATISPPQASC